MDNSPFGAYAFEKGLNGVGSSVSSIFRPRGILFRY